MKAFLFAAALVAGASAAAGPGNAPINSKYLIASNGTCVPAACYNFTFFDATAAAGTASNGLLAGSVFVQASAWSPLNAPLSLAATTTCSFRTSGVSGNTVAGVRIGCTAGCIAGQAANAAVANIAQNADPPAAAWSTTFGAGAYAVQSNEVAQDLEDSTFSCFAPVTTCNIACTGGSNCNSVTSVAAGATITPCSSSGAQSVAQIDNVTVTTPAETYTCSAGSNYYGSNYTFTCVGVSDACSVLTDLQANFIKTVGSGFSTGKLTACNCDSSRTLSTIVCPDGTTNCYSRTGCCLAAGCTATRETRANNFVNSVVCPTGLTLAQVIECFRVAQCNGDIQPAVSTCSISQPSGLPLALDACPYCNDSSKKGLLGLLGLLGLIPLLLCSLLCCLLLLCIRRSKAEKDVHFATFDAGAAPVAPVHNYQTVHTETFVGPQHCDAPFGAPMPVVY